VLPVPGFAYLGLFPSRLQVILPLWCRSRGGCWRAAWPRLAHLNVLLLGDRLSASSASCAVQPDWAMRMPLACSMTGN